MRIALIGDVHANLPALEAVLRHALQNGAQTVWNVGDFVGYGPFPDQVVRRIQSEGIPSIIGNYDQKVLHFRHSGVKTSDPQKMLAFAWAERQLSPPSRIYLSN